jgi:hypothetical protein
MVNHEGWRIQVRERVFRDIITSWGQKSEAGKARLEAGMLAGL